LKCIVAIETRLKSKQHILNTVYVPLHFNWVFFYHLTSGHEMQCSARSTTYGRHTWTTVIVFFSFPSIRPCYKLYTCISLYV